LEIVIGFVASNHAPVVASARHARPTDHSKYWLGPPTIPSNVADSKVVAVVLAMVLSEAPSRRYSVGETVDPEVYVTAAHVDPVPAT
jgi:hypothetical protein